MVFSRKTNHVLTWFKNECKYHSDPHSKATMTHSSDVFVIFYFICTKLLEARRGGGC